MRTKFAHWNCTIRRSTLDHMADGQPGPSDDDNDDDDDVHSAGDVLKAVADGQTTFF